MTPLSERPLPVALVILAIVLALGSVGLTLGLPMMLLVGAGTMLVGVVLLIWSSVQSLTGSTPLGLEEALGLGAPSVEEERKQSVLRALKDLEYERSVGKISEEDYRELSARYRAEAKRLLKALDEDVEPYRRAVLAKVDARLAKPEKPQQDKPATDDDDAEGPPTGETPSAPAGKAANDASAPDGSAAADPTEPASSSEAEPPPRRPCPECETENDLDARFCKACAAPLEQEASAS